MGILAFILTNAVNYIDPSAKAEKNNVFRGAFSAWPKEAGLAATRYGFDYWNCQGE